MKLWQSTSIPMDFLNVLPLEGMAILFWCTMGYTRMTLICGSMWAVSMTGIVLSRANIWLSTQGQSWGWRQSMGREKECCRRLLRLAWLISKRGFLTTCSRRLCLLFLGAMRTLPKVRTVSSKSLGSGKQKEALMICSPTVSSKFNSPQI